MIPMLSVSQNGPERRSPEPLLDLVDRKVQPQFVAYQAKPEIGKSHGRKVFD